MLFDDNKKKLLCIKLRTTMKKYLLIFKIFFPMGMTWKDIKDIFSSLKH